MGKSAVTAGYTNAGSMAAKWAKIFLLLENRESMAKLGLSFSVINPLKPISALSGKPSFVNHIALMALSQSLYPPLTTDHDSSIMLPLIVRPPPCTLARACVEIAQFLHPNSCLS